MPLLSRSAASVMLAFTASVVRAQAPSGWVQVLDRSRDHVQVQARIVNVEGNPCIQFRNLGQEQVHFTFAVRGAEPSTGLRVHLNPRNRSAFLPLAAGMEATALTSASALQFSLVRTGPDREPGGLD